MPRAAGLTLVCSDEESIDEYIRQIRVDCEDLAIAELATVSFPDFGRTELAEVRETE